MKEQLKNKVKTFRKKESGGFGVNSGREGHLGQKDRFLVLFCFVFGLRGKDSSPGWDSLNKTSNKHKLEIILLDLWMTGSKGTSPLIQIFFQ